MANACEKRQRYGVGNIGAHDPLGRHLGVKKHQSGDADRTRPDRRNCHQHTQDRADKDCQAGDQLGIEFTDPLVVQPHEGPTHEQRNCREQNCGSKNLSNKALRSLTIDPEPIEKGDGQHGHRDAAGRKSKDHFPVNCLIETMNCRACRLGGRCIQQISTDRAGGMDAKHQNEDWRHERAAAYTGKTNKRANQDARKYIERIDVRQDFHGVLSIVDKPPTYTG